MDKCKICDQPLDCYVKKYATKTFIDNKYYDYICHACSSVPTSYDYDQHDDIIITYANLSPFYLNNITDLMGMGWTKAESETSIKAVQKKLRIITSILPSTIHILDYLVLGPIVEVVKSDDGWKLKY